MKTDSYFNECQECYKEFDTKVEECPKCGSYEFELIDVRKTCPQCKEKKEEDEVVHDCERCGKEVCLECVYDDFPYGTTLCMECGEEWHELMIKHNFTC